MAKTANVNVRIDPETKAGAQQLFAQFGITISDAINIFLRKSLMEGGLPFDVKQPRYNAATEAAMREALEIINDTSATATVCVTNETALDSIGKAMSVHHEKRTYTFKLVRIKDKWRVKMEDLRQNEK